MKQCERCGGVLLTFGKCTTAPIRVYLPVPTTIQKQPFRCPVCGGNGLVPDGFYDTTTGQWTAPTYVLYVKCRSCNGTGIVWGGEK